MNMPQILYKYLDAEGAIKTLENHTLKFSSPLDLNDPFECLFGEISSESVSELISELYKSHHFAKKWTQICRERLRLPKKRALALREHLDKDMTIEQIVYNTMKEYDAIRIERHKQTLDDCAISCFSDSP